MKKNKYREFPFDLIMNKIQSGVFRQSVGKRPKTIFANSALCSMLDYTKEEAASLDPHEIFANKRTYDSVITQVVSGKEIFNKKAVLKDRNGVRVSVFMTAAVVKGAGGKAAGCADFLFKRMETPRGAEKDLANSKELFKTVFDN